ncbi:MULTISPECIES: LysR family transcriptional regulator [unclassified Phyllobacterium]|uniref:LysR family transcriptional regulator n=1 Tax=unclassified Phyllobacterium TaxID=2638441 RepID=UPI003012CC2A
MHPVNQSRLRYFFEVLSNGSIRAAADKINSAPSVISRQIKLLEDELGVTLFERSVGGVLPTESAKHVLEYWRACQSQHEVLEERLRETHELKSGHIQFAIGEGFIDDLVDEVLLPFSNEYPDITFTINTRTVNDVCTEIAEGISHIGLAFNPPKHPNLKTQFSTNFPLHLVMGNRHPLNNKAPVVSLAAALSYPVVLMPSAFGIGKTIEMLAFMEGVQLEPALLTNSVHTLTRFIRNNRAVAFLGAATAQEAVRDGNLASLVVDHQLLNTSTADVLVKAERTLPRAASEALKWIAAHSKIFGQK